MHSSFAIFKTAFLSIYPKLDDAVWNYIQENSQIISIPRKHKIIEEHKIQKNLFYLTSGLVRGFYINDKGEEITIRFLNNQGWVTNYSALIGQIPSQYIFQTLEPAELIILPFDLVKKGYQQFRGLETFGRLIAENVLKQQQERIESFQFLNAEQRYLQFIEKYPALFNRISVSHLCTYLGIQRQSLTRIRKKISQK